MMELDRKPLGALTGDEQLPFAPWLDVRKAAWCRLPDSEFVLLVGFDTHTARYVEELDEETVDDLRMTAQNLATLASRVETSAELRQEHHELTILYEQFRERDALLSHNNELLSRRTMELQDVVAKLQKAQAELVHQERLSAIGQLAAGVAHEVNNPASYVLSHLEELNEALAQPTFDHAHLGRLATEALGGLGHIVEIIRELGMFAKSNDRAREFIFVAELLARVQRLVHSQAKHRVQLTFTTEGDSLGVTCSAREIAQVLLNLILNAVQAAPTGRPRSENHVWVRALEESGCILLEVADNGPGIPESVRSKIFSPFFTTKMNSGGTGLGLSIASEIVRMHGGELVLAPARGEGACFVIRLPRGEPVVTLPIVESAQATERLRILLVDDDARVLRAHARKLAAAFTIECADGSGSALERLRRAPSFDAVLCDLMMPELNGYELWSLVATELPDYRDRFIFLTGGIAQPDLREKIEAGKFLVSRKPVRLDDVRRMVSGMPKRSA